MELVRIEKKMTFMVDEIRIEPLKMIDEQEICWDQQTYKLGYALQSITDQYISIKIYLDNNVKQLMLQPHLKYKIENNKIVFYNYLDQVITIYQPFYFYIQDILNQDPKFYSLSNGLCDRYTSVQEYFTKPAFGVVLKDAIISLNVEQLQLLNSNWILSQMKITPGIIHLPFYSKNDILELLTFLTEKNFVNPKMSLIKAMNMLNFLESAYFNNFLEYTFSYLEQKGIYDSSKIVEFFN